MKLNKRSRFGQYLLAAVYCLIVFPVYAESTIAELDQTSPIFIQVPKVTPATADHPLTVTAYVTDNVGVRSVTLYYRFGKIAPYFELSENRAYKKLALGLTPEGDYKAEIPKDQVTGNVLEYYVEVTNTAGNMATKGLPGNPFIVTFVASQVSSNLASTLHPENPGEPALIPAQDQRAKVSAPEKSVPEEDSRDHKVIAWYQQRWVWAVAGGVVLAAALGGGGGGSSSSPTGSVTIIAPPTQ